jgi:hypothetical protein
LRQLQQQKQQLRRRRPLLLPQPRPQLQVGDEEMLVAVEGRMRRWSC